MDSEDTLAMHYGQCHELTLEKVGIIILQGVLVGSILALRVYAMYNYNKIVLLFFIPAGLMAVGLAVWSIAGETWVLATQEIGCEYPVSKQRSALLYHSAESPLNCRRTALSVGSYQLVETIDFPSSLLGMAGAWEAQFLCDVIVFFFTVRRSYREPFEIPGSLLSHMTRDGALYFAVLALVNLANILMYYRWIASKLSWFTSTISVTMITRLMLHLQQVADGGILTDHNAETSLHFSSRNSQPWAVDRRIEPEILETRRSIGGSP
ncbi:hypothetical protein DFH06DRAFT_1144234 [Mycena polygramma]|nr:hypothetical protein DFH06DRAFT_1144234 [Mycena polygramma]